MENGAMLKRRNVWYGAVIAAVVLGVLMFGTNEKDSEDISLTNSPSDQIFSATTRTLIEHNRQALKLSAQSASVKAETAQWQEFRDPTAGFSIRFLGDLIQMTYFSTNYPLATNAKGLFLERLIPVEMHDACNGKGNEPLTAIPDFELGIRVVRKSFRNAVIENSSSEDDEIDDQIYISKLIANVWLSGIQDIGPFKGYFESHFSKVSRVCGFARYYIPFDNDITFIIEMPFPLDSLLTGLHTKEQFESAKVVDPRVKAFAEAQSHYPPIDREKLIYQTLSTFRLLDK